MRSYKYTSALLLLCLLAPPLATADSVPAVLNQARAVYKQADALQGAWLSTGKLIKDAEQALQKGDTDSARRLAKRARTEAQLSLEQAKEQQQHWAEPPYIRQ
jgi:phage shock protein A